ncbi:transcriptional regulator HilA [Variibacter gotjawalensis]|uniref:Transcriptional regulator HilA n=1 Tax=Variibacter gotjawalensis TaxID=1333996 RepID=A0A0S3PUM9_9BRAD|nr:winged helix-turn-helix domain-containing protein [Variibacter gotjawalensis]NIK49898.1 TolB-like protein/Flp pilus assembly protein TadD [Variibacter gotjawalensis]RZS45897.1 TolB-like protein [Variibacter gotjawalensis]BAT59572.1 transcriptional regulator HilA [Variibacter gotjawalensis]
MDQPSHIGVDDFVLDAPSGRLLGPDGSEIALRPKAFDLLFALAKANGTPLSKADLLSAVWGNVNVTEDSLFQAVRDARRAIGDPKGARLRSLPRRGYMLDAAIKTWSPQAAQPTAPIVHPPAIPDRPSIAVPPFRTLGAAGDRGYIAEGIAEEISGVLSRFSWLFVRATASAAAVARNAGSPTETGRSLGVRYILDGSVTFTPSTFVVRCRLLETANGGYVWQGRFDGSETDLMTLYDKMTSEIAAALEPRILRAEIERAQRRGTSDLTAFDFYLRALPGYFSRSRAGNGDAIRLLEAALEHDQHFHLARALLSRCVATTLWLGVEADTAAAVDRALTLARDALRGDGADPQIISLTSHLLALFANEHDEAEILIGKSLQLNANSAESWRLAAWIATFGGESDLALQRLDVCEQLDPISPLLADAHSCRAGALLFARRFEDAITAARRSIAVAPQATTPRRFLVSALHHVGAFDDAKTELQQLMKLQPNSSLTRSRLLNRYRHQWMTDLVVEGLGQSGMPEVSAQ